MRSIILNNEEEYKTALGWAESMFDLTIDNMDKSTSFIFDVLLDSIIKYEDTHYPANGGFNIKLNL